MTGPGSNAIELSRGVRLERDVPGFDREDVAVRASGLADDHA
jgi:HSP20 family molecular chaperone IbpA